MNQWQQGRVARLRKLAEEARADIDVLVLLDDTRIAVLTARFGGPYGFVQAHREDAALRDERVAAYVSAAGAEECPKCWVRYGARAPLRTDMVTAGADVMVCAACNFSELLPNQD